MTADIRGILNGAVPVPTKKEQQLAAKRQRDRKRYALKANQPWKTNAPNSDSGLRDVLQSGVQPEQDCDGALRTQPGVRDDWPEPEV